ncbi:MAG: pyridoxal phosphate enzyme (YggS family) [Candidatus Poriferisodalaceae bacterium]|jgi:pyridoxal phosphate enzyme (YggS family)
MSISEPNGEQHFDVEVVRENARINRDRIRGAGGDDDSVELLAVTKGFGAEAVIAASRAGLHIIGESYAQELLDKWPMVAAELGDAVPAVHFIGGLQKNKIRKLVGMVSVWQSIDRLSVAQELAKRAPKAKMLLQLNVSGQQAQGGCPMAEADEFLEQCRNLGLDVVGCMAIGVQGDATQIRAGFGAVTEFADKHSLEIRSMGMSGDLEIAVEAGSTMVRVGTAIFGARPAR